MKRKFLATVCFILLALPVFLAVPLSSALQESDLPRPIIRLAPALDEPQLSPQYSPKPVVDVEPAANLTDGVNVIIICVYFNDLSNELIIEEVEEFVNQIDQYYREASYGQTWLNADIVGWYLLDHSLSYYGRDGRMVDDTNYDGAIDSWKVLRDAVEVADPDVDFANYDKLMVLHAGYGQESSGNTNDLWSVAYIGSLWVRTEDNKSFYGGAIIPEMEDRGASALGVACHELAHLIGLPDLYSTKGLRYVGRWGLMDRGLWNGDPAGSSPAHPCAWSSLHLQWTPEDKIHTATLGSKTDVNVAPSGSDTPDGQVQLVKIPLSSDGKEYHLIEVRAHIGFDAALPGEGVIVYTVNERIQPMKGRVQIYDANPSTEDLNDAYLESGGSFINPDEELSVKVFAGQDESSYTIQVDRSGPAPDIAIEEIIFNPPNPDVNETISITAIVSNLGTEDARGLTVTCLINDNVYHSFTNINLDAGESEELTVTWITDDGLTSIRFQVEPDTLSGDSDPSNNQLEETLAIGYSLMIKLPVNATLTVNGTKFNPGSGGVVSLQIEPGSYITMAIEDVVAIDTGTRSIFQDWGDGIADNPRTLTVQGGEVFATKYGTQYLIQIESNNGDVNGEGWYDEGANVTVKAETPCKIEEKVTQLVFDGWTGDLEDSSSTVTLTVDKPTVLQANWRRQFYLSIISPFPSTSGEGWYDEGDAANIAVVNQTIEGQDTRATFLGWTGDYNGAQPSAALTLDGPKEVNAVWLIEYLVTINSPYGIVEGEGWYPEGQAAPISITPVSDQQNGRRYTFKQWTGDINDSNNQTEVIIDSPKYIEAAWSPQYRLLINILGLKSETPANITVNGEYYPVYASQPTEIWLDEGEAIIFTTEEKISTTLGSYILEQVWDEDGNPLEWQLTADEPHTITAQYRLSFGCLIATAAYESELSPQVQYLRGFRDNLVMETFAGSNFMTVFNSWYYSFSPSIAQELAKNEPAKAVTRIWLTPLLVILEGSSQVQHVLASWPEAAVILAGIQASTLIGLIYLTPFTSPLAVILWRRNSRIHTFSIKTVFLLLCASICALTIGVFASLSWLAAGASALLVLSCISGGSLLPAFVFHRLFSRDSKHTVNLN